MATRGGWAIPDYVPLGAGALLSVKATDPDEIRVIGEAWFEASA